MPGIIVRRQSGQARSCSADILRAGHLRIIERLQIEADIVQGDLINQGLTLMLVGMGTVFVFLTLLVGATTLMSHLVLRFRPADEAVDAADDDVAAITAAVVAHRRRH